MFSMGLAPMDLKKLKMEMKISKRKYPNENIQMKIHIFSFTLEVNRTYHV
jgi:hypothetical protein